jgi:hypothetical protein
MADLTPRDWGRMYAYVFSEKRHNPAEYQRYKEILERDPVQGVVEIIQGLNEEYPKNPITFNRETDAICDVIDPPLTLMGNPQEIEKYRRGEKQAKLILRFAC